MNQRPLSLIDHVQLCRLSPQEQSRKRERIARTLVSVSHTIREPNFCSLSHGDLRRLFAEYDEHFFDGHLQPIAQRPESPLTFRLSKRMTRAGGKTTLHQLDLDRPDGRRTFEIAISTTLLFSTFQKPGESIRVGGLHCRDRMDALQRIFEHELIHYLELYLWNDSSCHQRRFKEMIRRFFGHVESYHELLTPSDLARRELSVEVGDRVGFEYGGTELEGFVNHIQRRATVLVPHRAGERYDDGRRYLKYYVPLGRLWRCDS